MIKVRKSQLKHLPKPLQKFYDDFPVITNKGDLYLCPKTFNLLTVAWYINESKVNPNVVCDRSYNFFAKREIKTGEELTADYSTYNEFR